MAGEGHMGVMTRKGGFGSGGVCGIDRRKRRRAGDGEREEEGVGWRQT